jgi:hypothetical protein
MCIARVSRSILRRCAAVVLSCVIAAATGLGAAAQELGPLGPLDRGRISYFIAPPPTDSASRPGDVELARWALEAWQRAAGGRVSFLPAENEAGALVRVYWAPAAGGQYGEMRALEVDGRRGAAVFVRPDTSALGEAIGMRANLDSLFRDTIVYLTCLHELGHALGLGHTDQFDDVMYFFGFGGDIPEFFGRYRRALTSRGDIARVSGLSPNDIGALRALYESDALPLQVRNAN